MKTILLILILTLFPQFAWADTEAISIFVGGTLRTNHNDYLGFRFTVGPNPIYVTKLGRYVHSAHTQNHPLKITADGSVIALASCTVDISASVVGTYEYCTLPSRLELSANTTYAMLSYEQNGFDNWFDDDLIISASADISNIPSAAYVLDGALVNAVTGTYRTYGPPNFKYSLSARSSLARPPNNLGLVAYYSFDEGSGGTVGDSSNNGYKGEIINSTSWVTGKRGKALNNVGSGSVMLPNSVLAPIASGSEITVSTWFKGTNAQSMVRLQPAGADYIVLGWDGGGANNLAIISTDGGTATGVAIPGIEDNAWHHVSMTWKKNTTNGFKVYVDGVLANQRDSANADLPSFVTPSFQPWLMGYGSGGGGELMSGTLDETRIFSRELTAAQIKALYSQGVAVVGGGEASKVTGGLVGYWPFNGKDVNWSSETAGTAYDRSSGGKHGALTNMNQLTSVVPGKLGQALNFDGVDDYVLTSGSLGISTANATFAAWVKGRRTGDYSAIVHSRDATYPVGMHYKAGTDQLGYTWNNNNAETWGWDSGLYIPQDIWSYVAITIEPTKATGYLCTNGTCSSSENVITHASQTFNTAFSIGLDVANPVRLFQGVIDDVRIYERTLSSSEINQLYKMGGRAAN